MGAIYAMLIGIRIAVFVNAVMLASLIIVNVFRLLSQRRINALLESDHKRMAEYTFLMQSTFDLFRREGKELAEANVNAARAIQETVRAAGPLSDSGPDILLTAEQRAKAIERIERAKGE